MKKETKRKTVKKNKQETLPAVVTHNPPAQMSADINLDPQYLIQTAIQTGASMEILERLLDVRERLRKEQAETAYRESMSAFQSECPVVIKRKKVFNKDNTIRYKYAPLDDIVRAVQPFIGKHEFSFDIKTEQILEPAPMITAHVKISHAAGYSETSSFGVPTDKDAYMSEPQKWLSAATFAKRIAFCNGFGIMTGDEDNDANDPVKTKQKAEEDARAKEAIQRLNALPENIKKGFEILDYKMRAQWVFCNDRDWDNERIQADINKIVDQRAPK
jgi:hypothetical protein